MVFLQSELETVTVFCGLMKSTLLCVNISLYFHRLEQLQNERGSVVVKTDAGPTTRVNKNLWLALKFLVKIKRVKRKSTHCWGKESGAFWIISKAMTRCRILLGKTGILNLKCQGATWRVPQSKPMNSSAWSCSGAQLPVYFKSWLDDFNSQAYLGWAQV